MTNAARIFYGNYPVSLDVKKRVAIPKPLREVLAIKYPQDANQVVATVSSDSQSVTIYPASEFEAVLELMGADGRELDPQVNRTIQQIAGKAQACPIDGQGRIRIPNYLLEEAAIDKKAVFAGAFRKMHLWNPDRHAEMFSSPTASLEEHMKRVSEMVRTQSAK